MFFVTEPFFTIVDKTMIFPGKMKTDFVIRKRSIVARGPVEQAETGFEKNRKDGLELLTNTNRHYIKQNHP